MTLILIGAGVGVYLFFEFWAAPIKEGSMSLPITVELRGGPFDGQLTCVLDPWEEVTEVLGDFAYIYQLGGFKAGQPAFFDLHRRERVELTVRDQVILDECHTDEAERRN